MANRIQNKSGTPEPLAKLARLIMIGGAIVALGLTLYVGRHNQSLLRVAMFAVWVVSPFAGFLGAFQLVQTYATGMQKAVYAAAIGISLTSLVIYSAFALAPHVEHAAFPFLAVPAASWLSLIALMLALRFSHHA